MDRARRRATVAWCTALAAAWLAFAVLGYASRDPDSRLYAEIAARMADAPPAGWIAPEFPPGWFMSGPFREHPPGLFWPAALLARLGYPAGQAAYATNALYQVATLVLLPALAAALVPAGRARALGWALQLLPIAFTYRARANHEQAVVLCLVLALLGTDRSRRRARWAALTAAALAFLLLVKGLFALFGPLLCALWLLATPRNDSRNAGRERAAWLGLGAATLAMLATAAGYELLYRSASGEPFWSFYASRQLGVATAVQAESALLRKAANVAFYVGRILWFAFPWSLALVWEALASRRPATQAVEPAVARRPAAAVFVAGTALAYVLGFSLFDRRADRYVFPAYYAVGAAGVLAALARFPRLARLAERLDRPWLPACVFVLTLGLHLAAGPLGLPRVDVPPRP
jgi:4-amino-4-deoxy-L-arabinose transferase-like glycosyltransferase